MRLAHNGGEFEGSALIDHKLKKIEKNGKETKWQYTPITKTEGGKLEKGETKTLENNDTIYVVYTKGIQLATVETVDSDEKGFYLYMENYDNPAGIGGGTYKNNVGSITQNLYSSTIGKDATWPTTVNGSKSLSNWFSDKESSKVNNLFIRSVYDETGYYYYNSAEYFATLGTRNNGSTTIGNTFTVYNQLGSPEDSNNFWFKRGNFMPYNTLNPYSPRQNVRNLYKDLTLEDSKIEALSETDPRYNEALYAFNEDKPDFYFGMYGTADFYQPVGGKVNDQNMIYEFTGDDDMVVYIDGILVLDLGGIHDAQTGRINFATGEVDYTTTANLNTIEKGHTTIKKQFEKALTQRNWNGELVGNGKTTYDETDYDDLKWKGNTFTDNSLHRIQFFYMERGAGASNLKLKVNIPTIPKGSVTVQKQVKGLYAEQAKNETYTLQLKTRGNGDSRFSSRVYKYTLSTDTEPYHETDRDGKFSIPGNATATFIDIDDGTEVKVSEKLQKGDFYDYKVTYTPTGTAEESGTVKASANGHVNIIVKNTTTKGKNLTVKKKFMINGSSSETAPNKDEFKQTTFQLKQSADGGTTYQDLGAPIPYTSPIPYTPQFQDGSYTFENLDPRKTYTVVENITSKTDGGNSTTPYTGTDYAIGDITETTSWTTGTTSGEISLQTEQEDGTYHYYNNKVTFVNKYQTPPVNVEFTKVDAEHTDTGLEGAKFALYTDENATTAYEKNGEAVTATSGKDGKVTFTELPYRSTYYMKEIQAPSGYVLDNSTIYTISITVNGTEVTTRILKADGSEISDLKIKNTAIETELTFYKKSKTKNGTEISLDGAVFEIKRLEGSEYKKVTDIIGVDSTKSQFTIPAEGIKLTKIKDGTYQIREITAPAGYNLLTEPISFVIENGLLKQSKTEVVTLDPANKTVTIFNTAGIQLPETGGMGTLMTTMSGMALMLIALGYLVLVKRREKGGLN